MKIKVPGNDIMGGRFYDDNGVEIVGVRKAEISMEVGQRNTANIELVCIGPLELEVEGKCLVYHPETRKLAEVESIQFKDGTVWPSDVEGYDPQKPLLFNFPSVSDLDSDYVNMMRDYFKNTPPDCEHSLIESRYEPRDGHLLCVKAACAECGEDMARSLIPASLFSAPRTLFPGMDELFRNNWGHMFVVPVDATVDIKALD